MTALAIAMLLTGAGEVVQKPGGGQAAALPPPPIYVPYPPPPLPAPSQQHASPPAPPGPILVPWSPSPPPAVRSFYPRRARADFNTYFSIDDYPLRELHRGVEGDVGYNLVIGPDGRVSDCTVTASSGSRALDAATCRILQSRARYSPARNALGAAVSGQDSGVISWRIPPGDRPR